MRVLTTMLLLLLLVGSAGAAGTHAREIYRALEYSIADRPLTDFEKIFTYLGTGYVLGVFDALSGIAFDPPDGATSEQAEAIVLAYLRKHPEERPESASEVIIKALSAAWPMAPAKRD